MNTKKTSAKTFSTFRFISKMVIGFIAIVFVLIIVLLLALPSLFSSEFARKRAADYLSRDLQRPVSVKKISFSWKEGIAVSGFNIKNKDRSPFFDLNELRLIISWPALIRGKIDIEALTVDGIELTFTRDKFGKTNISDILEASGKEVPEKEKAKFSSRTLPALFLEAHIKEGNFTFIDKRLNTITRVKGLSADLSLPSLTEPINILLKGDIILNNKAPESVELTGTAHLAAEGKFNLQKARGDLKMKASFGNLEAIFDLAKFNSSEEVTGATLSCFLDLNKLARLGAGILGLPPGFSLKGQLESSLKARGNIRSHISLTGKTLLKGLSIKGGPFRNTSFEQPQIIFSQDVLFAFATSSVDIKSLALKSNFINLSLSGKIADFLKNPNAELLLSGRGDLDKIFLILAEISSFPSNLKSSGIMNLSLSATGDLNSLNIKGTTGIENLKIYAAFLGDHPFREKFLRITPDILVNIAKNNLKINSLNIHSEILEAEVKGTLDGENNIDTEGNFSAEFFHLKKQLPGLLPSTFPQNGQLSSNITVKGNLKKSLLIKGDHSIKDAKVFIPISASKKAPSTPTVFSLPKLTATHDVLYAADQDKLTLGSLKADSPFFNFEGSGSLSRISKNLFTKCQGKISLNMSEIQKLLEYFLPEKLTAKGKGDITFSCQGSLNPPEGEQILSSLNGNGTMSIEAIAYQGLGSIRNLKSIELSLDGGVLISTLQCLLNNGPSRIEGTLDFSKKKPAIKINMEGKDIQLSQDIKMLGYIVPVLIMPSSGRLSGKGNFSVQAAWQGMNWESEISRTVQGKGKLSLKDGIIRSQNVLSLILKSFGEPEALQFEEILTGFRLGEGKIYNDKIQVNGKDLDFTIQGWTSLRYEPSRKGNPLEYTVKGNFLKKSLGKDAEKVLSILGGGEPMVPVVINGTVQKPRISIKMPRAGDLLRGILNR